MIKVSTIKKNPANPRQIKGEKLELLKHSITDFEKMMALRPMVVDETNTVLGGNMRLAAIKALGMKEIPDEWVKRADDLTAAEKARFTISDNAGFGEWDWDQIANEWTDYPLADWGLDVPGFESIDEAGTADAEPQMDKAAELNKKWKVRSGDLWQIGEHRLLCGSCTEKADVDRLMQGGLADAVLTDPPYGQSQDGVPNDDPELHRDLMMDAVGLLPIENGVVIAFQSPRLFVNWLDALTAYQFKFERMLWMYKAAQCTFPWRGWILKSESILAATKGDGKWQEVRPFSHDCYYLSEVSGELDKDSGWHGSVKPLKVVSDLLSRICPLGSIVYEPFSGSGTTLVACQNLGRKGRAIEITPEYVAVALERFTNAFPTLEIKRIEDAKGKATN